MTRFKPTSATPGVLKQPILQLNPEPATTRKIDSRFFPTVRLIFSFERRDYSWFGFCLVVIQSKNLFKTFRRDGVRERERERVVCVCERERERKIVWVWVCVCVRERDSLKPGVG